MFYYAFLCSQFTKSDLINFWVCIIYKKNGDSEVVREKCIMLFEHDPFERRFMVSYQDGVRLDSSVVFVVFLESPLVFLVSVFVFRFQDFLLEPIDVLVKFDVLLFCSLSEKMPSVHF